MICWKDQCYCMATHCKKYETCRDAFPQAVREIRAEGRFTQYEKDNWPISVSDCSGRCESYEKKEEENT